MNVVLIGASGFLGKFVVQALSEAGHQCQVLTRQAVRRKDLRLIPGVELCQVDVYDTTALAACFESADAVVSMAGILNEAGFSGSGFQRAHVQLVEGIIEACQQASVSRVLHISAIGAGEGKSHYLISKGQAEEKLRASGLDVTIFRPSVVFGPGDQFFNRFAEMVKLAPVLPLACPKSKLQPVFAGDIADVMATALEDDQTIGQVYELGGPEVYTLQQLVQWTAKTVGSRCPVPGLPTPIARLQAMLMDFVPGKPFSTDNFRSLQSDNVASEDGFKYFGVKPASIGATVPNYLVRTPRQSRLDASRSGLGPR